MNRIKVILTKQINIRWKYFLEDAAAMKILRMIKYVNVAHCYRV